ncbi:kinesin-like protein KIF20B [Seriola dumerili]|uniref:kinesin-like protein KIF20B n=1 Tax=Seriola dumerili TaxID=41447 RepID=UPI000BBE8270|nr:kinesin-like protein KIF20B [Seriola dumerili]
MMTDLCPNNRAQVEVDDLKRVHSSDFCTLPDSQHSSIEEREHLQVYLRIRPFTSAESSNGESQDCVAIEPPDTVLLKPPSLSLSARLSTDRSLPQTGQRFQFSQVYGPETTQRELFEGTVKDLVKDVLEGGNSLVFTYGVTNAGKTFTFLGPDADAGILPRSLDVIFSSIDEHVFPGMSIKPHRCREFTRLTREQQAEEALFKRNLFKQLKESERSNASILNATNKTLLEAPSILGTSVAAEDRISLEVETNTKFSVWVSFCEIYNENIHDLLEVAPSAAPRRTVLRLSQDVKGNAFVKDLRWVQVNSAEEAYKVMKLGKRNQSFSSTRLNQLSSRSHSIFSIRVLRIEDIGTPRVHTVSELCLCDLAGSERCAKTQNKGERLKEAGNINTSLLILGKCINALRHNQQAKLLQHVPFRESKLTHYLQGFFCGRGKACMIVNINQCASMYDETLNVLKFSAVAQKVVVLSTRPPPIIPQRSASEASVITNSGERRAARSSRRSSLNGWESSLEDVQEDVDDECEEEDSLMEVTVDQTGNEEDGDEDDDKILLSKKMHQRQVVLLKQLQVQLKKERAESLLLEARVREEISREFSELFSEMQNDYSDRLGREREILEERAERRLEIFKNLIDKMAKAGTGHDANVMEALTSLEEEQKAREDALTALEYQTVGKEEALASLEEERKAREETLRRDKEKAAAGLAEERRSREEALAALEEARSALETERKERGKKQQECEALQQEVRELTDKLEAAERQVTSETERAERALVQLQSARKHLDEHSKQIQEKTSQIHTLTLEAQGLTQELQTTAASSDGVNAQLRDEASELRKNLADEKEKSERSRRRMPELERELAQAKEQLAHKQQLEEFNEKLSQQEEASKQQIEELRKKLEEQEDVRSKLECQELASREEVEQLRAKLEEQTQASEKQVEDLNEKLREQKAESQQLLEELKHKLSQQKETSDKLLDDLKRRISEQEQTAEQLKAELGEAKGSSSSCSAAAEEELKRLNHDLQTEVASLRAKLSNMEETKEEAELQKKLLEAGAEVTTLQKSLKEAQERREEEESQAVQEARRREAERRRELLAVAHEAIAQKDEELEKRAEEISRLKESAKRDSEKVKSLGVDLQRKEDDTSDLREKLADYKKQIQQVQKEISAMREEEKLLKQKLSDVEKTKKQLQSEVAGRDRTIQQLKLEQSSEAKSDQTLQLYQKSCKDLEAKERVIEDMRLALTEQEETQEEMEHVLEEKLDLVQELSGEVEKLKGMLLQQDRGNNTHRPLDSQSDDLKLAKQEAARAQESLKLCTDKHQAERKKWLEEKLSLIGQAKEAEDKRNQDMRKFADDRERYNRQQSQLESLSSQLSEKDETMEKWRKERDTLVAALEVQLQKLLSSQAEKDKLILELRQNNTKPPQECADGGDGVAELQAALREKEADIQRLKEALKASTSRQVDSVTQTRSSRSPATPGEKPQSETLSRKSGGRMDTRASVSSQQGSAGCPSVLDSSEISTENGRTSRFPRPELEISFSPLQPNRMALRRQGEESAVTVKITRSARKRKSGEMEKEEVEAENRRNTRTKLTAKLTAHQEEISSPPGRHDSRSRKEGTLQKIGDFLQSSPTLLGTKAKKMMSLVSGRGEAAASSSSSSSSSLSLRAKKNKRKLYRPEISSPMDMPSHPIISREPEEKESDHQIIKRRLRSRTAK